MVLVLNGTCFGMLVVKMVARIGRVFLVQGKSIKAICRDLRVSRKVVRKVLRSEATEFRCERGEQPLPRIGPWQEALDQLLKTNKGKALRERLTLTRYSRRFVVKATRAATMRCVGMRASNSAIGHRRPLMPMCR